MGLYEEHLKSMLKKTAAVIEQSEHMKDILYGTMPEEKMRFQIRQNYQYLLDYTRCWAAGLSKCNSYDEMELWYSIVRNTMENTVMMNRTYWAEQLDMSLEEMDAVIEAPGKRSYTSFQMMIACQGDLAQTMMALFPCNIIYRYFGEDLLEKCPLGKDSMYYQWLAYYVSDEYLRKTENEIATVDRLCAGKTDREIARLKEICAISCNYEILQWTDMYHNMTTWPLDEIFPEKKA